MSATRRARPRLAGSLISPTGARAASRPWRGIEFDRLVWRGSLEAWFLAVAVAVEVLAAGGAALTLTSGVLADPVPNAIFRVLYSFSALAVGLFTLAFRRSSRMGPLLIVLALVPAVDAVQASASPAIHTVGRVVWVSGLLLLLYTFVVFPNGRMEDRFSRRVMVFGGGAVAACWLGMLLALPELPATGVLSRCTGACPGNPFHVISASPAAAHGLTAITGVVTAVLVWGVAVAMLRRLRGAHGNERRAFAPALVLMCAIALVGGVSMLIRGIAGWNDTALVFAWVYPPLIVVFPWAIFVGQARGRLFSGTALSEMLATLRATPTADALRATIAAAVDHPELQIVFWAPSVGGYVNGDGTPARFETSGRYPIEDDGRPVAALLYDASHEIQPDLLVTSGVAALLALENARLAADLRASIIELAASRTRIASAAMAARRQVERDLHDGAQQRLLALHIRLGLLASRVEDDAGLRGTVDKLDADVMDAIESVRSTANGSYPALLAARGLGDVFTDEADRSPLRVRVLASAIGRSTPEIEGAAYFCCLEALQNAVKHAGLQAEVVIRLQRAGEDLTLRVSDNGSGFDTARPTAGHGSTNMRDRIAAVGGDLSVTSEPGEGTTVSARLPWPRPESTMSRSSRAQDDPAP